MIGTLIIDQIAQEEKFSGVLSIFKGGKEIYNKSYGYSDWSNTLPNKTDTKFGIASGTKLFTAIGIGKLIEQGIINLDTTVGSIDYEYCSFVDKNATILSLLTHSSGIYDYYDEEIYRDSDDFFVDIPWYQLENPSDYLPLFYNQKMKFQPGERFSYSNGGFVFLAVLIEKLSNMKYRDYIEKMILVPAQMNNSGFYALNELPINTAIGYKKNRKTTNIYNIPIRGGGDGGMFTNTYDLALFWNEFFSKKILPKELTEKFLKTRWELNENQGYGCGIYKKTDDSMFYIVGGDSGVGFDSRYLPEFEIVINILSNVTDGETELRKYILSHLDEITNAV